MVALWAALFGIFILFIPFRRKVQRKPASIYLAFVVALAFEMFGVPLSIYALTWLVGIQYGQEHVAGHTLYPYIGVTGMYVGFTLNFIGIGLVIAGWRRIHGEYWSQAKEERRLVTTGVYRYMRHPQYTGFLFITLGLLVHWMTLPTLVLWPVLMVMYYRLARMEEGELEAQFGRDFLEYKRRVPMFFPVRFFAG